jgi:hypothetical protein
METNLSLTRHFKLTKQQLQKGWLCNSIRWVHRNKSNKSRIVHKSEECRKQRNKLCCFCGVCREAGIKKGSLLLKEEGGIDWPHNWGKKGRLLLLCCLLLFFFFLVGTSQWSSLSAADTNAATHSI